VDGGIKIKTMKETSEEIYLKITGCLLFTNDKPDIKKAMIEFAKLHVEAALKAKIQAMEYYHNDGYSLNEMDAFTNDSYPLENIK
jgi:hypothetical protein